MIDEDEAIDIVRVRHIGAYKLNVFFSDGTERIIDFAPFLSASRNPLIRNYLNPEEFRKYEVKNGDLEWNDYDLCFPVADLYENKLRP